MIGLLKNLKLMKKNKFISYSRKPPRTLDIICQLRHSRNGLNFLVSLLTYLLGIFPSLVYALPIDGTVQAGSATISQVSGSQVNISQSSNKSIIDWNSFSIASGEQVNFQVPSSTSVTLNRVTGNDPSSIFGNLTSNGHLMLINRNGILFGSGSEIDVHGLVATTSDISNHDFINGQYRFNISPEFSNTINNQGTITAAEGGLVAFVAPGIKNTGTINARLGKVSLAAGNTFTLDLYGDQLVNLGVDSQVIQQVTGFNGDQLNSLVSNSGSIYADGGVVTMDVQVAQSLIDNVVNMSGYIQAKSIAEKNGAIYLTGGNEGLVKISGTIDATGLNIEETGGIVHVLGNRVGLYDYALIDVSGDAGGGLILVGGDYQGLGSIPTAVENYVGPNVSIFADAVTGGNGGRTIFWADRRTKFFGTIRSRGGRFFGDGGFAEVSGKEELYFDGSVDTTAPNGKSGTLLLDPEYITISGGSGTASASSAVSFTTYESVLEAVASTTNINMVATKSITLNESLNFAQTSGQSVTFTASGGNISFTDSSDTIQTSGGNIVMNASGTLSVGKMKTNGGNITLTGGDFSLSGTLDAGKGTLTILGMSGETIGLDGITAGTTDATVSTICDSTACGLTLTQSELNFITAAKLVVGDSSSGKIYVDGVTTAHISGGTSLNSSGSGGSVIFGTGSSTLKIATINAGNGVTINGDLSITGPSVFNTDYDLNGTGTFTVAATKALTASTISISANDVGVLGTISSGTGSTTIAVSDGGTIGLGGTTGDMTISGAELGNITAGTLNIGNSSTGNITVDGISAANSNNATTVNLTTASASSVSFSNNDSIFNALTTSEGSSTSFGSGLTVTTDTGKLALNATSITSAGALTLTGATGIDFGSGVTFTAGGDLTMSTTSGDIIGAGAFTLTSTGNISLAENFTTAGATVITADSDGNGAGNFSNSSSTTLSTGNSALTLTANDITLSGSISSGTGSTTIAVSDGGTIGLGGTTGDMTISGAELGNITAGTLNIGNSSTGNITVDGISAANSNNATTVNLTTASASSVSFSNNDSIFNALTTSEGSSTSFGSGLTVTTDTGKLALNATSITSAGALTLTGATGIDFGSGVTFTAGGDLTMSTTSGDIIGAGAFTLTSTGNISLAENFTTAGATVITADSDGNGAGNFSNSSSTTLSTGNSALTLTANDITLSGSISSGTGSTTIAVSDGGTIGLGGTTGNMTISGAELGNITAGTLNIGDSSTGNITVDGISAANSNNATTVNLTTASASSVSFSNNASTFQALGVNAGNGINQGVNITTDSSVSLDADSNNDGSGDFSNSAGTFTTGGNTLSITANDFSLSGAINTGSGTAKIFVSDAGTIGLGSTSANMTISGAELGNITAGTLTIGDSTAGAMTVNGISSSDSANISTVDLNSASIAFSTGGSTFKALTATANTGTITGVVPLTVTTGNSNFTTSGANQAITLSDTSNNFTGAVSLNTTGSLADATLTTNSSIILGASSIGGDQSVTVGGTNKTINITGAQNAGETITLQSSGDLTLTSSLTSSSSSNSAISLTSTSGGILDGDSDGSTDIEAVNGRLVAVSNGGFGTSANAIETKLKSIDLINNTAGDINIYETDSLEISQLNQTVNGKDIAISYYGNLSGQDLAINPIGSLGKKNYAQRQPLAIAVADRIIEGMGKSINVVSIESTVQLANTVEGNIIEMTLQKSSSGKRNIGSLNSNGSMSSYVTDIFSKSPPLVKFSKDAKEIYAGSSKTKKSRKKLIKKAQVAKLETAIKPGKKTSKNSLQTNKASKGKKSKKRIVTGRQSIKNQRRGLSNLTPTLATRPTERGFASLR